MRIIEQLKRSIFLALKRFPVYRLMPASRYRDYAAIHHLYKTSPGEIPAYLSAVRRAPTLRASSLILAAKVSFDLGNNDDALDLALRATQLDPRLNEPWLILSDIEHFSGNYADALKYAQHAWLLQPASDVAATRVVRLSYANASTESSDRMALFALGRFKRHGRLLWTACKHCRSESQLESIRALWFSQASTPRHISAGVRPLALAALHLERFDVAVDLYARGCLIELRGMGIGREVSQKQLAGKSGLSVLADLRDVLEAHNIPFFFAAGTALGIIRDGKPLDHDDDIDVGVFREHWDREKLTDAFREHPRFMLEATMAEKSKIRLVHRGGAEIDIFEFYRDGDSVFHNGNFVRWKNTPFTIDQHELADGSVVPLPSNVDRYLTENYGNWHVPNSRFDAFVDGPNAEITSAPYFEVHRIRRAYKFIRSQSLASAHTELTQVKSTLMQCEAGRELVAEMRL